MEANTALKHHAKRTRIIKGMPLVENWATRLMDLIIYPIGFLSMAMAIPQAYSVWVSGSVEGLSLVSWTSWTIFAILWTIYGFVHKNRVLIIIHGGWIFMNGLVALGIYFHS